MLRIGPYLHIGYMQRNHVKIRSVKNPLIQWDLSDCIFIFTERGNPGAETGMEGDVKKGEEGVFLRATLRGLA